MADYQNVLLAEVKDQERFCGDTTFLETAVAYAVKKVEEIMPDFVHSFPSPSSVNLMYGEEDDSEWTCGFWTGMLWLSYELTGNELYRAVAEAQYDDYKKRYKTYHVLNHHDIGFLYIPSIVAQYKLTGGKKAKKLALSAAKILANRYSEKAGIIQVRDRDQQGHFIIDCSMNIPLLYWAAFETGDRSFYLKALNHMNQAAGCMVREDASTYQCFKIDEITGQPVRGWQGQGYSDDSCWARGQAWIIYGLAISYRYTKETAFLEMAKRVSNYFLNHLPSDLICNWDLIFTEDEVQRDSSSAPVAACGLLEIAEYLPETDLHKKLYYNAAVSILRNLAERYTTKGEHSNGILMHGVYCKDKGNGGWGDDECCIWGDYFYMEGLRRLKGNWNMYW